jgi:cytochrome c biogenesis protein CcmG/thiol:disulfide interchange protein DsbE
VKLKVIILAVLFLAGAAFLFFNTTHSSKIVKESGAPGFEVREAVNGNRLSSSDLKNKIIFINFWASWCQPCKEEMPSIESLYREMKGKEDFVMITILYKDSPESAIGYMKSNGYTFPVYIDPDGSSARNYGVTGVPETYVVDKKGALVRRVIGGADWNSPEEKSQIKAMF